MIRNLAVLLLAGCQAAFAWGELGHRLVVRIAEGLLTPATRAQIQATLNPGESLVDLASWADEIRAHEPHSAPWHYVDIPLGSLGYDAARDCPKGACVVAKVTQFEQQWRDPAAPPESRREALLFLIHFAGDLHQPLHCANNQDEGGNQVHVRFFGTSTTLHAVWDTGLLDRSGDEEHLYERFLQALTPDRQAAWVTGTAAQWANESFRLAQGTAYGLLPTVPKGQMIQLGSWYLAMAEPVAELQLEKAGVRLAALINGGACSSSPPAPAFLCN